jgi:putative addiction module killer protein
MSWTILRTRVFAAWLEGLRDRRAQTIIAARIERVSAGNMGDVKSLGGGLQEIRIDYATGYRVYFAMRGGQMILLLVGGDKSSQRRDIAKARAMLDEER